MLDGTFVDRKSVEFVPTKIHRILDSIDQFGHAATHYEYSIMLPTWLSVWDVWDYWERERIDSMKHNLTKDDVLLYIGAEHGAMAALTAQSVDPSKMILVEPSPEFWPGIKDTWKANGYADPMASFQALISEHGTKDINYVEAWPESAFADKICVKQAYRYVHNEGSIEEVGVLTIDQIALSLIEYGHPSPITAISIDIEGAELLALRGARNVLQEYKPIVWVSIHPDLMERDYGHTREQVIEFMFSRGYDHKHLATDHEEHWVFTHRDGKQLV